MQVRLLPGSQMKANPSLKAKGFLWARPSKACFRKGLRAKKQRGERSEHPGLLSQHGRQRWSGDAGARHSCRGNFMGQAHVFRLCPFFHFPEILAVRENSAITSLMRLVRNLFMLDFSLPNAFYDGFSQHTVSSGGDASNFVTLPRGIGRGY